MLLYQKEPWQVLANPITIGRNLYRHRTLLWRFTWRNIELQHKGSTLGLLWSVISPLLMFGAYAFVFIAIFNGRYGVVPWETKIDYAIGLFFSLSLLQLVQETMTLAPLVVVQHPSYVKKVVFPLEILPAAAFGAALFRCLISLALVVIAVVIAGPGLAKTAYWLPVIVGVLAMFALGVAWFLAALGVFLRDIAPLMNFTAVILMFLSGVFYSPNAIPSAFRFLRFNPLLIVIGIGRDVLLWHQAPHGADLLYLGGVGLGMLVVGHAVFCTLRPAFPDVI